MATRLINIDQQAQHDARIESLKEQHKAIEEMVEAQRPQPVEFETAINTAIELDNGVVAMPGDFYNKEMGIAVSKDDQSWQPAPPA